jgi:hypothetical protein
VSERRIQVVTLVFIWSVIVCIAGWCAAVPVFQNARMRADYPAGVWFVKAGGTAVLLFGICLGLFIFFAPYVRLWWGRVTGTLPFRWQHLLADVVALPFLGFFVWLCTLAMRDLWPWSG